MVDEDILGINPLGVDTRINFGVPPLMGLEATRPPTTGTSPQVTQPPNAGQGRELLAGILLSLGESLGGEKSPGFLRDVLKERAGERRQTQRDAAILARQRENALAILERQKVMGEEKEAAAERKAKKLGQAVQDIHGDALQMGTEFLDWKWKTNAKTHLIRSGQATPEQAESIVKGIASKWEISDDKRTMRHFDASGKLLEEVPVQFMQALGDKLITTYGRDVLSTFIPPARTTITKGQGIAETPGQLIPGPATKTVPPSGGIRPVGGIPPTPQPTILVEPKTPLGAHDMLQMRAAGVTKDYVEEFAPEEARLWTSVTSAKPTPEQAPLLTKRQIPTSLSWDQIRLKYPNAPEIFERDLQTQAVNRALANWRAKNEAESEMPFIKAHPTSSHVTFNKKSRQRDPMISTNDILAGKGVALDPVSTRNVGQLQGVLASITRLEKILPKILAEKPGMNLGQALKIAVERRLASSADIAAFDAITGPTRLATAAIINQGRPSDKDDATLAAAFPSSLDIDVTGLARLRAMKGMLLGSVDGYLGNDVGPLTDKEAVPRPPRPGSLKPGGGRYNNQDFD